MNGRHCMITNLVTIVAILSLFFTGLLPQAQAQTPTPTQAQEGAARVTLTDFKVLTIDGKDSQEPLMAGATYKVNFTINVAKEVSDTIILETDLTMAGDRYWELKGEYKGINLATWAPGRSQISFRSDEGKANLVLTGAIPENFNASVEVESKDLKDKEGKPFVELKDKEGKPVARVVIDKLPTGQILHQKKAMTLLRLSLASRTLSQDKKMEAIDKSIETYQATFTAKKDIIENQSGEDTFVKLVLAVAKEAQSLAATGNTDAATALLKTIPDKGWPQSGGSSAFLYLIMGLLAVVALLFVFLMIKSQGAASYNRNVVQDQVKKLDVVSVRAGRLGDKALVQEINTAKDELDRISR